MSLEATFSGFEGSRKRRKYQLESTKVSIVSTSRLAGPEHFGQRQDRKLSCSRSGIFFGCPKSNRRGASVDGSWTGKCSSATGTTPQVEQWTTGIGTPQYRCLEISQSRSMCVLCGLTAALCSTSSFLNRSKLTFFSQMPPVSSTFLPSSSIAELPATECCWARDRSRAS